MRLLITFFAFLFSVSVFGQNTQSMDFAYGAHHNVYLEYSSDFNMSSFTISFDIYPRSYCWSGNSACESCPLSRYEYGPGHEVIRTGFDTNIFYANLLNSDADILGVVYDSPLPLNAWTNIAFSYNNQVLNLYINGVLVDTANDMDFSINTSSTSGISIGELFAANGNWYNLDGLLDNVFIWNVLLNQEEINSIIECPIYSGEDGLITLFNFEEGEGNTVYDLSGNGNHGEVNGATWSIDVPEHNCAYGQVPEYIPTDGLVAWYPLDAGTIAETGLNAYNNAVYGEDRFGIANNSSVFDGIQEYTTSGLNYDDFTFSVWFKSEVSGDDVCGALISQNVGVECEPLVSIVACNIPPAVRFEVRENSCVPADLVSSDFNSGVWQHVVFIKEQESIRSYLNGIQVDENFTSAEIIEPDVALRFGSMPYGNQFRGFVGQLDDIGIWSRPLSSQEIQELYYATYILGCTDQNACNFNPEATLDDETCYSCDLPASHCGDGTVWDSETQECVVAVPTDTNLDGCTDLNDLMDILSAYGDCAGFAVNYSLSFDGVDDYISVPNPISSTLALSLNCWANFPKEPVNSTSGNLIGDWNQNNSKYLLRYDNYLGNHTIALNIIGTSTSDFFSFPLDNTDFNNWNYISFTYDGSSSKLYFNGVLKTTSNIALGAITAGSSIVTFGVEENNNFGQNAINNPTLNGKIDEVSIWNIALNASQIQSYMSTPPTGNEEGLVGYWDFNEGTGSTLTDQTSNGNHGIINGATWSTDVPTAP